MLPYGVHRNSMWGNDSDQFRPERWFDENRSSASAFAAFSFGKRICIGKSSICIQDVLYNLSEWTGAHYFLAKDARKISNPYSYKTSAKISLSPSIY